MSEKKGFFDVFVGYGNGTLALSRLIAWGGLQMQASMLNYNIGTRF